MSTTELRLQFFDFLFGNDEGYICIGYRPQGQKENFRQKFFKWPGGNADIEEFIENRRMGFDLWFGVNLLSTDKRTKQYCKPHNIVWADLDTANPYVIDPEPQVVIQSSPNRYQAIWRLEQYVQPDVAEDYSRRIAYLTRTNGTDPSGWDLTQLLRVPFTFNFKYTAPNIPQVKLLTSKDYTYANQVFENLPEVETGDVVYDDSLPSIDILPDADTVVYKYQDSLRGTQFTQLWGIEPDATDDWSKLLWHLYSICFEAGMSAIEVFVVAKASAINKFARDNRPIRYLWRDVCKAEIAQKRVFAIIGESAVFTPPEIITAREAAQLPKTIIDDYREWAVSATDAVPSYHDLCSIVLLSSLIAPGIKIEASYGTMVPNLWGLVLGDSTLTRKSTAMGMAMDFVADIDRDLILATDGSAEGILTGLQTRPKMTSIFFRDEITGLFDAFRRKEYMAGLPEIFTQLYDGRFFSRKLRKETITVTDPVFIFFGGGIRDKMYSLISEEYFISGFIPRFLVVSGDADVTKLKRTGPAQVNTGEARKNLLERFANLREQYVHEEQVMILGQSTTLPIAHEVILSPTAWERYGEIESTMALAANEAAQRILLLPVMERLSRSLLKMVTLFAAARQIPQEGLIEGTEEDVMQAAKYIQQWMPHSVDLVQNSGRTVFQKTIDKILDAIRREPGVSRGKLMQAYHLNKREMDEIHSTLIERGQVIEKREGRGYRYTAMS